MVSCKVALLAMVLAHSTCTIVHHDHHDDDHDHRVRIGFTSNLQAAAQLMPVRILDLDGDGVLDVAAPHTWWIADADGWRAQDPDESWESIEARGIAAPAATAPPFAGWGADASSATAAWLHDSDGDGVIDRIVLDAV